jgi:hypothetical protein
VARKTDSAQALFKAAEEQALDAAHRYMLTDGTKTSLEAVDARCRNTALAVGVIAEGLVELASAIHDVYEKLEAMDRKA